MNIALVTYQDKGIYHNINVANEDDQLLAYLESKGLRVVKAIWNDVAISWEDFDLVIIKSPWDYFNLITDFYAWLTHLKNKKIKVLNPIDILKWNADKHYLHDIANAGLNVTPSRFTSKGQKVNLSHYFDHFQTSQLIIKPTVSGGAKNTFKVTPANVVVVNAELNVLLKEEDFIIQPFLNDIEKNGEWSFIFFGGKFSHALLKKAKSGDFRVQSMFGGTVHPQNPPQELLAQAQLYVDQFAKNCLYARVDGTIIANEFLLMELELIEPFLFLDTHPASLENYFEALTDVHPMSIIH